MAGLLFLVIFSGLLAAGLTEEIPEFQYPCYVDICTFPRQFCNSERFERRCSPCTRAICRDKKVPLACKYMCGKYEKHVTTATPEPTVLTLAASRDSSSQEKCQSSFLMLSYSVICTTVILIVLLLFLTHRSLEKYRKKNKARASETLKSKTAPEHAEEQVRLINEGQTMESDSQADQCSNDDGPPSYSNIENAQETRHGRNGGHRQVCNTPAANRTPESNSRHHVLSLDQPTYSDKSTHLLMQTASPLATCNYSEGEGETNTETHSLRQLNSEETATRDENISVASQEETSLKC